MIAPPLISSGMPNAAWLWAGGLLAGEQHVLSPSLSLHLECKQAGLDLLHPLHFFPELLFLFLRILWPSSQPFTAIMLSTDSENAPSGKCAYGEKQAAYQDAHKGTNECAWERQSAYQDAHKGTNKGATSNKHHLLQRGRIWNGTSILRGRHYMSYSLM
jgi:hypothetical protein